MLLPNKTNLNLFEYNQEIDLQRDSMKLTAQFCLIKSGLASLIAIKEQRLTAEEFNFFLSLEHEKRQLDYLLGNYCAKQAVARYLKTNELRNIQLSKGVFQQPLVASNSNSNVQISISHTSYLGVAIAFSEAHPMGIDIETIHTKNIQTIRSQITVEEHEMLSTINVGFDILYTILWTSKEALSKVLKTGMMVPFEILAVNCCKNFGDYFICDFKHFFQYNALSIKIKDFIITIVHPKKTQLVFSMESMIKNLEENL